MNKFSKKGFGSQAAPNDLVLPIDYNKSHWTIRKQAREQYCREQMWKCYHCGEDLHSNPRKDIMDKSINMKLFPKGMFNHPIHLHHDHRTGMTIGAVHSKCNAVLWQYHGE